MKDSSKGHVSREEDGDPVLRLMIMGPPGAGKGTQAELLSKTFDLCHLSTGNILREAVQQGTPLGLKVKSYLDSGDLVPDEIVGEIIEEKLKEERVKERFLLDGFPRTERQVEILDEILNRIKERLDAAFLVHLDEGEIIQRLSGRRVCSQCATLYHVSNKPPKEEGICDKCGGKLVQRKDDEEAVIRDRLSVYKEETLPVITIYRQRGVLIEINGGGNAEKVFERIRQHLSGIGK